MAFKPKRTPAAELARLVEVELGANLPTTMPSLPQSSVPVPLVPRTDPTVQINFRASKAMAQLISHLAKQEGGSTRKLFARMLKEDGYTIPESDLNPQSSRRQYD